MALVTEIETVEGEGRLNPTHVVARVKVFGASDRRPIVQVDTCGSPDRKLRGKTSQTLQFDAHSARQLFDILKRAYGFS